MLETLNNIQLGEEQVLAIEKVKDFITNKEFNLSIVGAAGTGKSLIVSCIIKILQDTNIDYCLCAPTHKAKTVIEHYTGNMAVTLHKLLSLSPKLDIINLDFKDLLFNKGAASGYIPYRGIVICDEASMISDDLYKILCKSCKEMCSKIIFISDKAQIKPVKSERVSLVYNIKNTITLTKIYRQSERNALMPILQRLREHEIHKFDTTIGEEGSLLCDSNFAEFFNKCKNGIYSAIQNKNIFECKVLAYTNKKVDLYNKYLTKTIFEDDKLYHRFEILMGCENLEINNFYFWNSMDYIIVEEPKEIDIFIPNFQSLPGYSLTLYDSGKKEIESIKILSSEIDDNYYKALAYKIECTRLDAIRAKNKSSKSKAWREYYKINNSFTTPIDLTINNRVIRKRSFDKGYAITTHRAQGSSYDNIYIDMEDINRCNDIETKRQLQYVALSRTRNNAYIYQK